MPLSRFSPLEESVARTTSGLVIGKLDGESAEVIWFR